MLRSGALLAEGAAWIGLAALLVLQLLSYDYIMDPDPDGYVTYAVHLQETWSLLSHRRLPGYPLFLAVVDAVGPSTINIDAYWAHFWLYLGWAAALWLWARRLMGPLVGLVFLAILATPSFLTRSAVVMVADLLACITFALAALVLYRAIHAPTRKRFAAWLGLLTLLAALTFVIHPSTRPLLAVVIVSLGLATVAYRERLPLARIALALVVLAASTGAVSAVADRGSGHFITSLVTMWALVCLPPAADTEEDRTVEAAKRTLADRLGRPAAHAAPRYYPEFAPIWGLPERRQREMALQRMLAHPLGLPGCGAQQTFWRFPILAKQYAPFLADWRFVILSYPPADDSPRSTLFRTYGIELTGVPASATWDELWWPAVGEVARFGWFLVTVCIGAAQLVRRLRTPALAVLLAVVISGSIIGLFLVLDTRYFLAFSPAIYLAEAVGIVTITTWFVQPLRQAFAWSRGLSSFTIKRTSAPAR